MKPTVYTPLYSLPHLVGISRKGGGSESIPEGGVSYRVVYGAGESAHSLTGFRGPSSWWGGYPAGAKGCT
jgi:hypothetical protein